MTAVLGVVRDLFVRPAAHGSRPVGTATRAAAATSLDVALLCPAESAWATAATLALGAARTCGARGAVVALWRPSAPEDVPSAALAAPSARRRAARLHERGVPAVALGRLVVVALPADADDARVVAERLAATVDVPLVTVVAGPRPEALDRFLAQRGGVLVAVAPDAPPGIAELATVEAARIARAAGRLDVPLGAGSRLAARTGWLLTSSVRSAVDRALRGHHG